MNSWDLPPKIMIWIVCTLVLNGCSSVLSTVEPTQVTFTLEASVEETSINTLTEGDEVLTPEATESNGMELPACSGGVIAFHRSTNTKQSESTYAICPDGTKLKAIDPDLLTAFVQPAAHVSISEDRHTIVLHDSTDASQKILFEDNLLRIANTTFSPDKKYIAFDGSYNINGDLYYRMQIIHIQTGTITQDFIPDNGHDLPIDEGYEWINWSPVGNQLLLFSRQLPLRLVDISCVDFTHECTTLNLRNLSEDFSTKIPVNAWSPDGTKIAYAYYHASTDVNGLWVYDGLVIIDAGTGSTIIDLKETDLNVLDIDEIAWSPDGDHLVFRAFQQKSKETDIFLFSLSDNSIVNLTANLSGSYEAPIWLP